MVMYSEVEGFSESLIEYIMDQTGLSKKDIIAVLKAERKYYLKNLIELSNSS